VKRTVYDTDLNSPLIDAIYKEKTGSCLETARRYREF